MIDAYLFGPDHWDNPNKCIYDKKICKAGYVKMMEHRAFECPHAVCVKRPRRRHRSKSRSRKRSKGRRSKSRRRRSKSRRRRSKSRRRRSKSKSRPRKSSKSKRMSVAAASVVGLIPPAFMLWGAHRQLKHTKEERAHRKDAQAESGQLATEAGRIAVKMEALKKRNSVTNVLTQIRLRNEKDEARQLKAENARLNALVDRLEQKRNQTQVQGSRAQNQNVEQLEQNILNSLNSLPKETEVKGMVDPGVQEDVAAKITSPAAQKQEVKQLQKLLDKENILLQNVAPSQISGDSQGPPPPMFSMPPLFAPSIRREFGISFFENIPGSSVEKRNKQASFLKKKKKNTNKARVITPIENETPQYVHKKLFKLKPVMGIYDLGVYRDIIKFVENAGLETKESRKTPLKQKLLGNRIKETKIKKLLDDFEGGGTILKDIFGQLSLNVTDENGNIANTLVYDQFKKFYKITKNKLNAIKVKNKWEGLLTINEYTKLRNELSIIGSTDVVRETALNLNAMISQVQKMGKSLKYVRNFLRDINYNYIYKFPSGIILKDFPQASLDANFKSDLYKTFPGYKSSVYESYTTKNERIIEENQEKEFKQLLDRNPDFKDVQVVTDIPVIKKQFAEVCEHYGKQKSKAIALDKKALSLGLSVNKIVPEIESILKNCKIAQDALNELSIFFDPKGVKGEMVVFRGARENEYNYTENKDKAFNVINAIGYLREFNSWLKRLGYRVGP